MPKNVEILSAGCWTVIAQAAYMCPFVAIEYEYTKVSVPISSFRLRLLNYRSILCEPNRFPFARLQQRGEELLRKGPNGRYPRIVALDKESSVGSDAGRQPCRGSTLRRYSGRTGGELKKTPAHKRPRSRQRYGQHDESTGPPRFLFAG